MLNQKVQEVIQERKRKGREIKGKERSRWRQSAAAYFGAATIAWYDQHAEVDHFGKLIL